MTDFLIDVIVDPSKAAPALDKVDSRLQRLEKSGKRLQNTLRRAITLVGITAAARQLGVFADSLTNVKNRIRLVTKDTAQLNAVTKKLFDISARTRTGFAATATIFSRTALAVKDLGLSLQETLDFTEALNQAIVLSGVKAQEANAGLIQLSQGLASGTLRGDELRSVLEQLPKVADLIAGELGVLRGELRILGEQGKITTADIIKAFTGLAAADLTKAFAESVPTMSQGFSVLTTRIIEYIGQVDAAHGVSTAMAKALITLSAHLETVGKVAIVAGAALAGPFAKAGVLFAARAVTALTAAILANPIGAIVVVALAAAAAVDQFGDSLSVSEDGLVSLKDVAVATWNFIVASIAPVLTAIKDGFTDSLNFVIAAFGTLNLTFADVAKFAGSVVNTILSHFVGLARALRSVFKDLKTIFSDVLGEDLKKLVKSAGDFTKNILKSIGEFTSGILSDLTGISAELTEIIGDVDPDDKSFVGTFLTVGKNAKDAYLSAFKEDFVGDLAAAVAPGLKQIDDASRQISEARRGTGVGTGVVDDQGIGDKGKKVDTEPFAFKNQIRLLQEEAKNLSLVSRERGIANELLELEEKLRASNVTLNPALRETLELEVRRLTGLREQADVLDELTGPQDEIGVRQQSLNTLYKSGAIDLAQFNREMKLLQITQAELNAEQGGGTFAEGFITGISDMLDSVRNFSTEAGLLFADFFTQSTEGFSQAIAGAIVFGETITESIGNAARAAIASLLAGLIDVGIKFVLNSVLSDTLKQTMVTSTAAGATAEATAQGVKTAAALAAITTITAATVASSATIAASAAAPAALVSLASFGANSVPATAGILATTAAAETVAATAFLAEGGFVSGPGGPTSDSIPARLSDGEFVVNAQSTERFRPQLEAINNGAGGNEIFGNSSQGASQEGAANNEASGGVNVINVLDPSIVEDFIDSPAGEKVVINVIERNATAIGQLVGGS